MRFLQAILFTILLPGIATAQLKLDDLRSLLEYADEHAPAAQQAKLQPLIAKDDKRLQASGLYPRVNAFATGDYYPLIPTQVIPAEVIGGAPGTFIKAQFGLPYVFTAGAELSIPVVNFEKWTQLSKAKEQYNQAIWSSKAALESFHIQLMQAYYQVLVTNEVLKLNDENAATADELLRIIEERNKAGVLNPADYNRTRNLQLDVQSTKINYARTLRQNINNLRYLLNVKEDSLQLSETLEAFDWPLVADANEPANRPAWQEANLKVRVAELALKESKNGALPKLMLNSRYAYNMQSKLDANSANVEFDVANVGLRFDVPLFQGNYYRTLRHKNSLQLKWAKLEQERVHAIVNRENEDWYTQYRAAYRKQSILKQKIASASDNLRIANLNIKEGVMEFDEYNNIFIEYNRAKIEYLQNLSDGILYYLLCTQNL